uniref:Uncharacterized protein n=1 Tax=Rhizophora mucronata TaxID=61149 RepID=A0A2P2PJC3_RHIMU
MSKNPRVIRKFTPFYVIIDDGGDVHRSV